MRSMLGGWLGVLLALAGCPKQETPAGAKPSVSVPRVEPKAPEAHSTDAAPPSSHAAMPAQFARMGEHCGDVDAGSMSTEFCDARGRVAGVLLMFDLGGEVPPASAEVIRNEPPSTTKGRELTVALEAERLW